MQEIEVLYFCEKAGDPCDVIVAKAVQKGLNHAILIS